MHWILFSSLRFISSPLIEQRAMNLWEILSAFKTSQIANSGCILNNKKFRRNFNVYVACSCSPLPSLYRYRCQDVWFQAEKTKERKISTKLTDELKQKNVYLANISIPSLSLIQSFAQQKILPTVFFIVIYLKCQYGTELNSFRVVNRQPKSPKRSYVNVETQFKYNMRT